MQAIPQSGRRCCWLEYRPRYGCTENNKHTASDTATGSSASAALNARASGIALDDSSLCFWQAERPTELVAICASIVREVRIVQIGQAALAMHVCLSVRRNRRLCTSRVVSFAPAPNLRLLFTRDCCCCCYRALFLTAGTATLTTATATTNEVSAIFLCTTTNGANLRNLSRQLCYLHWLRWQWWWRRPVVVVRSIRLECAAKVSFLH